MTKPNIRQYMTHEQPHLGGVEVILKEHSIPRPSRVDQLRSLIPMQERALTLVSEEDDYVIPHIKDHLENLKREYFELTGEIYQ